MVSRLWGFYKLRRRQRARGEASHVDRALEIEQLVHAHAYRSFAGALRRQMDLTGAVQDAVDVTAELGSIVDRGNVIPGPEGVQMSAIQERLLKRSGFVERVQAPFSVDHADLEQHAIIGIRAARGIFFEMEPALF